MITFNNFKYIFKLINSLCWDNNVSDELTFKIAFDFFNSREKCFSKNKNIIRLIGQSGSGKTTQLFPVSKELMLKSNLQPFTVSVRDYANLHPKYKELFSKYGKSEIREKTNCFALKCLLVNLIMAIESGFDIIFEVTLLTKKFEKFINTYLDKNCYNILNLCLAVNNNISNYFIEKRKNNNNSVENNRTVYISSSKFFYKNLNLSLKYYVKKYPNNRIIIWNVYNFLPVYDNITRNCYNEFRKNQKIENYKFNDEDKMLQEKIKYVLSYVKLN